MILSLNSTQYSRNKAISASVSRMRTNVEWCDIDTGAVYEMIYFRGRQKAFIAFNTESLRKKSGPESSRQVKF